MNKQYLQAVEKFNALSLRERLMVLVTIVVLCGFLWWNLFALPLLAKTRQFNQQNIMLASEIKVLDSTIVAIKKRINDGVHKSKRQRLALLKQELQQVSELLETETLALIEPDEMFELMQQLIFAESRLKLTAMKRKQVKPVFSTDQHESQQPEIYQHVLQMSLEGKYKNVLEYMQKLESLEWKLIWDRITLKTAEYPILKVTIEMSTLSDNQYWVGL